VRRIGLICLLVGLALPVFAVGKVSVDPNAPGAAAPGNDAVQANDRRLSRHVSISQARTPVWKILDEMNKSSGVVLKACSGSYDWQVRDRKMIVFAKDTPLVQNGCQTWLPRLTNIR